MKKSVFIVTHRRGFEADPVIDELRRRGIAVFRFNGDSGTEASRASFATKTGECEYVCDGRRITGPEIAVGWCQQLPPYLGQASSERESLQRENLLTLQFAAFDLLPIPWLNRPCDVVRASDKIHQLTAAHEIGLAVPDTLVSNDPVAIRTFVADRTVAAKNLATPWVVSHEHTRAAYTRIVDPEWLADDTALSFAPIIYQEFCERQRDYRVVVVGDRIFAASCVPEPHQREDVRKESGTGESYRACDFDADAARKLRSLMHNLHLDYCAADFMEDNKGTLYFLEVNTTGAWWWIDRFYNGAICNSIVDALMSRADGL